MYAGVWHYNKLKCCEPRQRRVQTPYRKRTKSNVQRRPREEWIPLVLPSSLQLVSRERWERVQARLQQNRVFSSRNENHSYLLKGLVSCGACGARYVGDSWHGRFYYRCSARCKRLPSVREHRLDNIVIDAVESLPAVNPATRQSLRQDDLKPLGHEDRRQTLRLLIQDATFDGTAVQLRLTGSDKAGGHNVTDPASEQRATV